jgi:hypothetical protein
MYAAFLLPFGIAGFAYVNNAQPGRRRWRSALTICAVLGLGLMITFCGGVAQKSQVPQVAYAVTISGISGSSQFSTVINVTVQ